MECYPKRKTLNLSVSKLTILRLPLQLVLLKMPALIDIKFNVAFLCRIFEIEKHGKLKERERICTDDLLINLPVAYIQKCLLSPSTSARTP